jgi:hypothetical protein
MPLDHTEDSAVQLAKLAEVTNQRDLLNEKLKLVGKELNEATIEILKATNEAEKVKAKIAQQEIKGKFAEIKADIKCKQDIISTIKYLIKMEKF